MDFAESYVLYFLPLPLLYLIFMIARMFNPPAAVTKDGRVASRVSQYSSYWKNDTQQEGKEDTKKRVDNYAEVINGYYDGATDLYELGWAKSFHFSRFYKGESFVASLARHEHYLAYQMSLKPGMRVLDVGCGIGGPAREIVRFSDVKIVGLNNNDFQLGRARKYTKKAGLENQIQYVKGDFMKLVEEFGENSFDAVYAIEATVHAPSWEGVYDQIRRVLKPGGIFGMYEWCMTDAWDPSIPLHKEVAHGIERGNGIPEMRPLSLARESIQKVGFKLLHEEDLAERDDYVEWYYPLEGDFRKAQTLYDLSLVWLISPTGRFFSHNALWFMEKLGLLPKGTHDVGEQLKVSLAALVRGGQTKLFTPMYLVISQKPMETSA